jgi:hypothetical protein
VTFSSPLVGYGSRATLARDCGNKVWHRGSGWPKNKQVVVAFGRQETRYRSVLTVTHLVARQM